MRERERRDRRAAAAPQPAPPAAHALLALQRSAGNHATAQLVQRQEEPGMLDGAMETIGNAGEAVMDAGNAAGRGAEMLWNLDDEGATYGRELITWRVYGMGDPFLTTEEHVHWNRFMAGRPEIQEAMLPVMEDIAREAAADGATADNWLWDEFRVYKRKVTDVRLDQLESMRLTLHGCHHIDVSATVYVTQDEKGDVVVHFERFLMTWVDRADLHPGTLTELESGETVDDSEFTAAGWDYDISIGFAAPEDSYWRVSGGTVVHERGWPPFDGAPAEGGFRG
jgi:hypothetical protein